MLHAKFQDHRTSSSGEDFKVFTIYGRGSHLGNVTMIIFTKFMFLLPIECPRKIWL